MPVLTQLSILPIHPTFTLPKNKITPFHPSKLQSTAKPTHCRIHHLCATNSSLKNNFSLRDTNKDIILRTIIFNFPK